MKDISYNLKDILYNMHIRNTRGWTDCGSFTIYYHTNEREDIRCVL